MSGVPFTVMKSCGGPYDDESFMSGFHIGTLNFALSLSDELPDQFVMPLYSNVIRQADLVAMKYGWFAEVLDEQGEWSFVRFRKSSEILDDVNTEGSA